MTPATLTRTRQIEPDTARQFDRGPRFGWIFVVLFVIVYYFAIYYRWLP